MQIYAEAHEKQLVHYGALVNKSYGVHGSLNSELYVE